MNIYINNIRITILSDAGSLNVGTTLNMVQTRSKKEGEKRVGPQSVPPEYKLFPGKENEPEAVQEKLESYIPGRAPNKERRGEEAIEQFVPPVPTVTPHV